MASLNRSTDEIQIGFQKTQSNSGVNDYTTISSNKTEDGIYERPISVHRNDGRIEDKHSHQKNCRLRFFMALVVVLMIAVLILAVSS